MPVSNLSTILPERKADGDTFPAEYLEMQSMRRAFLRSWDAWLRTGPPAGDVEQEAYATASAHRQIADLAWMPTPPPASHQRYRRR